MSTDLLSFSIHVYDALAAPFQFNRCSHSRLRVLVAIEVILNEKFFEPKRTYTYFGGVSQYWCALNTQMAVQWY